MHIESILCPICGKAVESSSHIFFVCPIAREVFRKIAYWWDVIFVDVSFYEEWLVWISILPIHSKLKLLPEGVLLYYAVDWLEFP